MKKILVCMLFLFSAQCFASGFYQAQKNDWRLKAWLDQSSSTLNIKDLNDKKVIEKIKSDYGIVKNKRCIDYLVSNSSISYTATVESYVKTIYDFFGEKNFTPRDLKKDKGFDAWSKPNDIIRMNWAIDFYNTNKGKAFVVDSGICSRGHSCLAYLFFKDSDNDIRMLEIRTPYFQSFCREIEDMEGQIKKILPELTKYPIYR
jgi:hypothetical protein